MLEEIERIEEKRLKAAKQGKIQLILIAAIGGVMTLLGVPFMFRSVWTVIFTVVELILAATVFFGAKVVRYLYAVIYAVAAIVVLLPFLEAALDNQFSLGMVIVSAILFIRLAFLCISSGVLFASKKITEYLYEIKSK